MCRLPLDNKLTTVCPSASEDARIYDKVEVEAGVPIGIYVAATHLVVGTQKEVQVCTDAGCEHNGSEQLYWSMLGVDGCEAVGAIWCDHARYKKYVYTLINLRSWLVLDQLEMGVGADFVSKMEGVVVYPCRFSTRQDAFLGMEYITRPKLDDYLKQAVVESTHITPTNYM